MGFWTVWALNAQGNLKPQKEGSEQCLGRHSVRVAVYSQQHWADLLKL